MCQSINTNARNSTITFLKMPSIPFNVVLITVSPEFIPEKSFGRFFYQSFIDVLLIEFDIECVCLNIMVMKNYLIEIIRHVCCVSCNVYAVMFSHKLRFYVNVIHSVRLDA